MVNERSDGIWPDRWAGGMIQIVFVIFCPLLRFLLPTFILVNARWIVEIQKHHYDDDEVLPVEVHTSKEKQPEADKSLYFAEKGTVSNGSVS